MNLLTRHAHHFVALLTSGAMTLLLFYLDEGRRNFDFTTDPWNWFWFGFYWLFIFGTQWVLTFLFCKNYKPWENILVQTVIGLPLGVALTIGFLRLLILFFA